MDLQMKKGQKNTMLNLKQKDFVEHAYGMFGKAELTVSELKQANKKFGCKYAPQWLIKNSDYKVGKSLFKLPLNAKDVSTIPKRTYHLRMKTVQVPSNYDSESRRYTGNWSGEFKPELEWTDNPAWCLYDLISNKRFGVGRFGIKEDTNNFNILVKKSAFLI